MLFGTIILRIQRSETWGSMGSTIPVEESIEGMRRTKDLIVKTRKRRKCLDSDFIWRAAEIEL